MCPGSGRVWTILHVIWSVVYVTAGAAQLIAGIFFLISLPTLRLTSNLWAGSWNVVIGIAIGMVACFGELSSRRQELLLYMVISILTANTINAVLSEWIFYHTDMTLLLVDHPFHTLVDYARIGTAVASATVILVSFLDAQFAFCSMNTAPRHGDGKKLRHGSHEQVSDIEYIIPRPKSNSSAKAANSSNSAVYNAYAQSWVFEADVVESPCGKEKKTVTPHVRVNSDPVANGGFRKEAEPDLLVHANATTESPVVLIEEASDDTNSNSDRKLCYMKSFSHNASPVILSACSSQISLNNPPPIYECLTKLTEQSVYRSRLNTALSNRSAEGEEVHYQAPMLGGMRREATSPRGAEKGQYASLMMELEKAIIRKDKSPPSRSSSSSKRTATNSKSSSKKNSDAEFSKELEAALQLIQDLESPNTIETPSEPLRSSEGAKALKVWRNSDASDGSEKTLSALGSLAELQSPLTDYVPDLYTFKPPPNLGKAARALIHCPDSQSTSGYSSPTHHNHKNGWSSTSSTNSSSFDLHQQKALAYSIHNTKSSAVISLYPQSQPCAQRGRSVTLVTITSEDESVGEQTPIPTPPESPEVEINNNDKISNISKSTPILENLIEAAKKADDIVDKPRPQGGSTSLWNVKSILRKKKTIPPKLNPELESAIVKSESLAYMTKLELLARHQRSKEIQRQIEQRIQQQLGTPKVETVGTKF